MILFICDENCHQFIYQLATESQIKTNEIVKKLIQEAYDEGKRHGYDDGYSESRGEGNYNPDGF